MATTPLATEGGAGERRQDKLEHHDWYENRQLNTATLLTCPFFLGYEYLLTRLLGPHVLCANAAIGNLTAHTGADATTSKIRHD